MITPMVTDADHNYSGCLVAILATNVKENYLLTLFKM
jgi:hypothetical protein